MHFLHHPIYRQLQAIYQPAQHALAKNLAPVARLLLARSTELSGLMVLTLGGVYLSVQSMPALSGVAEATWPNAQLVSHLAESQGMSANMSASISTSMIFETQLNTSLAIEPAPKAKSSQQQHSTRHREAMPESLPAHTELMAINAPTPKLPSLDDKIEALSDTVTQASDTESDSNAETNIQPMIEKTILPAQIPGQIVAENLTQKVSEKSLEKSIAKLATDDLAITHSMNTTKNSRSKVADSKVLGRKSADIENHKKISTDQQADNLYHQALDLLRAGRVAEAQTNLADALVINPNLHEVRLTLAALLLDNQHLDEAAMVLSEGVKIAPQQVGFSIALARLRVESSGAEAGLKILEKAMPYAKDNAEFHGFLAILLQRVNRNTEAINHFKIALVQFPSDVPWLVGLGISLQNNQQFNDAREVFSQVQNNARLSGELADFVETRLRELSHKG